MLPSGGAMKAMKTGGAKVTMKKAMKAVMMKAMKSMKGTKVMKKAMKKAMKVKRASIIARGKLAKALVFRGSKQKTPGGLTKDTLTKSKTGKIVSKAMSARAKKNWANSALKKWIDAVKQARKALGVTGFCAVNGKTAQGKAVYAKAKAILG